MPPPQRTKVADIVRHVVPLDRRVALLCPIFSLWLEPLAPLGDRRAAGRQVVQGHDLLLRGRNEALLLPRHRPVPLPLATPHERPHERTRRWGLRGAAGFAWVLFELLLCFGQSRRTDERRSRARSPLRRRTRLPGIMIGARGQCPPGLL